MYQTLLRSACTVALGTFLACPVVGQGVSFDQKATSLAISVDGRPLGTYVWQDREILRPYFAHLHAPDGAQVTRNHPPLPDKDLVDHATMHPGLWLAFGDLSGADFWRNKGIVTHQGFVEKPSSDARGGSFAVRNSYAVADKVVCEELCRIVIRPLENAYLIIWDSQFSGPDDFYFGDQEEMGLGVRMATALAVKNGGQIIGSGGQQNEKQVWGQSLDWCDYRGTLGGRSVGVLMMPDPQNFRPCWFHARDYGLLVANPFGQNAFTKAVKSQRIVPRGEMLRLRFGVLIHSGDVDLPAAYRAWLSTLALAD